MEEHNLWRLDKKRRGALPLYQYFYRKTQITPPVLRIFPKIFLRLFNLIYCTELSCSCKIGPGLFIGHPFGITINPNAVIGRNVNIHKGVTIGKENRGARKGVPIIGNCVWIGINSTIVGHITIGDDVMIAPNTFVNCDIPSHSVVFGNPCVIKHRDEATAGYINNKV